MATRVGTKLGRYEVDAELGRGAMGVVYRSRDPKIDRTVAIKTVSLSGLEPGAESEYRERFVVEARAAGRLSHPGVVAIFDVGEEAETRAPYLVMEYIEGQSLQRLLSGENRLPLSAALQLIQEVAEALHYAHEQGVVHRDIKPANILVTAEGHPKITDFGIAKLNQTDLTLPGHVLGSPAYMAPEQLSDEGVDARSDLFSLGVILYFVLTGHRPFQGNSTTTVCFKLLNHEPLPVSAFESTFPPQFDAIVSRAIAKNPAQRYQSGMEMASDIQRLRERLGSPQKTANLKAGRAKQQAVPDLPEPLPRQTPDFGKPVTILTSWLLRLSWRRVLALALLACAIGFVAFSQMHSIGQRRNRATGSESAIEHRNWGDSPAPYVAANANLHIEINHKFTQARASVWLDNQLVYTRVLHAGPKKHMLFFRKAQGHQSDAVQLPAGKHQLRVRVQSPEGSYDQSKTLAVNFTPTGERTLHLSCDAKHNLLQVSLQ